MNKLRLIPQEQSKERIVKLLREKLAEAEAGNVQRIFMFSADANNVLSHTRDGMTDEEIVFAVEVVKRRILGSYA